MSLITIQNLIGGNFQAASNNVVLPVINPATMHQVASCPDSTKQDLDSAVVSAKAAFADWQALSVEARSDYLLALAESIEEHQDELAKLETDNTGKPLWLSQSVDIPRAAENFRFFASLARHTSGHVYESQSKGLNITSQMPLGIVACISPWNLPLYLLTWKLAPALVTGNVVIAKPSEVTPLSAFYLAELTKKAGLPDGVLNIIFGQGSSIGQALVEHPDISAVSFTGGTDTGKQIAKSASASLKKVSLELGGKNPAIVCNDADLDKAIPTLVRSSFSNQGQICLCTSRIYIEDTIYDEFKTRFLAEVEKLVVGCPLEATSNLGALSSKPHFDKVMSAIEVAQKEGGTLLYGGQSVTIPGRCEKGLFVMPTVFENLAIDSSTNQTEIFGPVVTLNRFTNDNEAIKLANSSNYGLASTVFSQDISRCQHISKRLEAGIVWVNTWMLRELHTPFGGMKQSGIGREGGEDALRFFTEAKTICFA